VSRPGRGTTTRFAALTFVCVAAAVVILRAIRGDLGGGGQSGTGTGQGALDRLLVGCRSPAVSEPTTVLDADTRRRLGLVAWPDTQPGVLRAADGTYHFLSTGATTGRPSGIGGYRQQQVITAGSLDAVAGAGTVSRNPLIGAPPGYQYVGSGQIYRSPRSGVILQTVHLERGMAPDEVTPFYTEIGLARLDPLTYRATFLGLILRPAVPFGAAYVARSTIDLGTPSLVERDGFLYVYFSDFSLTPDGQVIASGLSVARTPLAPAVNAAAAGSVTPWFKYWQGAWTSPAWGGPSQDLQPGGRAAWEPSAAYDATRHVTLVVAPVSENEITLSQSPESASGWGVKQTLWIDPGRFDAYPIIVGTGADPAVPGATFYVYYLQWPSADEQDWSGAVQLRRTVTCLS
jgi:hypothetical protein